MLYATCLCFVLWQNGCKTPPAVCYTNKKKSVTTKKGDLANKN